MLALLVLFLIHFRDHTELLLVLEVEVMVLGLGGLVVDSLDLEFVGVHLGLVVFEFCRHLLQLLASLLQVLLVDDELLGHLGSALLRQDVLELDVQLLLLLDQDILLADLFSLGDESLLKRLDFLDELIGLNVS